MRESWKGCCWHCGEQLTANDYAREARCPGCEKPTWICRNCLYHAKGRPNDCSEPVADVVSDKERGNFCGYFEPHCNHSDTNQQSKQDMLKAAEDLFN